MPKIEADGKVSFIVTEGEVDDIHTAARLTLMAEAKKIIASDDNNFERYYRYFPSARNYHSTHNFSFYRLHNVRARYIGGFGKIHWIESDQLQLPQPFTASEELSMVEHMNNDHQKAIDKYCLDFNITLSQGMQAEMVGIDNYGCHLRCGDRVERITFTQQAPTAIEVRQQLVAMART